jgi:hypothetical protein
LVANLEFDFARTYGGTVVRMRPRDLRAVGIRNDPRIARGQRWESRFAQERASHRSMRVLGTVR